MESVKKMNTIRSTALLHDNVKIGDRNFIDHFCLIGSTPCHTPLSEQDSLKGVEIGNGNYFYSGTHVVRGTKVDTLIGDNCIFGQFCVIGHDSLIRDGVRIMNSCSLNGFVNVGSMTFIGTGSIVRNRITIGSNCYIGQGSNVVKDVPNNSFGYGNPFKVIRQTDDLLTYNLKRILEALT